MDYKEQIEIARRKPLTAENLNYIGDLCLKNNDKQRAVAYYFEACDKLHFAQKDKKIALYKKILNITPVSEKAYIGLIEILSKSGFVMEEKKYLHMLAQLYGSRGESDKVAGLFARIKELDPHVILDGTFFHPDAHQEVMSLQNDSQLQTVEEHKNIEVPVLVNSLSVHDINGIEAAAEMQEEKLIEATLEEIPSKASFTETNEEKRFQRPWYHFGVGIVLLSVIAGLLFYFFYEKRTRVVTLLPVTVNANDYEITVSALSDRAELNGIVSNNDLGNADFYVLTVNSHINCLPDAFATAPFGMISLLNRKGENVLLRTVEGLQKTVKTISKMNVCDKDNGLVFVRMIIAADKGNHYSGLAISGLQKSGPVTVTWESR